MIALRDYSCVSAALGTPGYAQRREGEARKLADEKQYRETIKFNLSRILKAAPPAKTASYMSSSVVGHRLRPPGCSRPMLEEEKDSGLRVFKRFG